MPLPHTPQPSFIKTSPGFWGERLGFAMAPQHPGLLITGCGERGLCPAEHQHHPPPSSWEEGRQHILQQRPTRLPPQAPSPCVPRGRDLYKSRSCQLRRGTKAENLDWAEMLWGGPGCSQAGLASRNPQPRKRAVGAERSHKTRTRVRGRCRTCPCQNFRTNYSLWGNNYCCVGIKGSKIRLTIERCQD